MATESDILINKGYLWLGDSKEVERAVAVDMEGSMTAVKQRGIDRLLNISQSIQVDDNLNRQYLDAKREAINQIEASLQYKQLESEWSNEGYTELQNFFTGVCPSSLVKDAVMKFKPPLKSRDYLLEPFDDTELELLCQAEKNFFESTKSLVLGPSYAQSVWELLQVHVGGIDHPYTQIRLNTIPGILSDGNIKVTVPVASEVLSRVLLTGVKKYLHPQTHSSEEYINWHSLVTNIITREGSDLVGPFLSCWPPPVEGLRLSKNIQDVISISSAILAAYIECGVADDVAITLILPVIYGLLKIMDIEEQPWDMPLRRWLWGQYLDNMQGNETLPERISHYMYSWRNKFNSDLIPLSWINSFVNMVSAILEGLYGLLDKLGELVFGVFERFLPDFYNGAIEYFYLSRAVTSALLPEQRRRPKAVWALLFASSFTKLTSNEKFALSCAHMDTVTTHPEYALWAEERLQQLARFAPDIDTSVPIPIRPLKMPACPTVADEELASLAPLMPSEVQTQPLASAWVKKLIDQGVLPGIDGAWFATGKAMARSLSRYDVERSEPGVWLKTLLQKSARALVDEFPEMYRDGKYLTPEQALRKIKIKFSPGLPHIPRYRSRKQLHEAGILRAISQLAEKYLLEGIHPGTMAHAFVKSDVVSLQKLLDGKNIRTVTAQDLLASNIAYCSTVEASRRQPPIDAFVMNAVPRSEGGFRPLYDELKDGGNIYQADAKEYDSKVGDVIILDGVVETRSLAYEGTVIEPVVRSQIKAAYTALVRCTMVDLTTGAEHVHTGGMLTGQANTGVDNRDSFRLVIISAWSAVTGEEPNQFFSQGNRVGNAGDDHVVKLMRDDIWDRMLTFIESNYGIQIVTEQTGFENVDLVGLTPIPVPPESVKYYKLMGVPVPSYSIASKPAAMLLKRTEWRSRVAGYHDVAFLMRHIEGLIGTSYLSAHHIGIFDDLAREYEAEATYILLRYFTKVVVSREYDESGRILRIFIELGSERPRYSGKTLNVRKWLKNHRFPSYQDVFRVWVTPQKPITKMAKDHKKILTWIPQAPFADRVLWGLIGVREFMYTHIPNHVARSLPEFAGEDVTYIMRNQDYLVAKFVWLNLYIKHKGRVPSVSLFTTALKENPYGSAEDPIGFLNWLGNEANLTELMNEDIENLRGRMVVATLFYYYIETIFKGISNIPGLSVLFNLYALSTRDINRLYAATNFIYMLSTGRSSPVISNLMPADPYAWIKQLAVILGNCIPKRWQWIPFLKQILSVVPWVVELWVGFDSTMAPRPYRLIQSLLQTPPLWSDIVNQLSRVILDPENIEPFLVIAPTGTGKSTAFLGAIMNALGFTGTIWLLCPTIVARDNYENPFVGEGFVQILFKGVVNVFSKRIKVLTYGHALNRLRVELSPGDLILFDEFHLVAPDMLINWFMYKDYSRGIITATPRLDIMPNPNICIRYPGERRFSNKTVRVPGKFSELWTSLAASQPEQLKRALIVCPTLKQVQSVVNTLSRLSVKSCVLSSDNPLPDPDGVIVATTIVDTAVTIQPPPTCLIDFGTSLDVTYNYSNIIPEAVVSVVDSSPSTMQQRVGRVGRSGNSFAYLMARAGLGAEPDARPSPFMLLSESSVLTSVLAAYKLTIVPSRVNNHPGILGYIVYQGATFITINNQNDLALGYYIVARLSDLMSVENLHHEFLNLRIQDSQHDVVNQLVNNIIGLGLGDPRNGNWNYCVTAVANGFYGFVVAGQFISSGALGIVKNSIVPSGFTFEGLNTIHPYARLPVYDEAKSRDNWMTYHRFVNHNEGFNFERQVRLEENINLTNFNTDTIELPILPYGVDLTHREVCLRVHRRFFINKGKLPKVYWRFNSEQLFMAADITINVTTRSNMFPGLQHIDLTGYKLPNPLSNFGLTLFMSAMAPDDSLCYWGEIPPDIALMPSSKVHFGLIRDPQCTFIIINPRYARTIVYRYLDYGEFGQGDYYLNNVTAAILTPTMHQIDLVLPNIYQVWFDASVNLFKSSLPREEIS